MFLEKNSSSTKVEKVSVLPSHSLACFRLFAHLKFSVVASLDDFNPVAVRVERKGDALDAALVRLLLKRDALALELAAEIVHVIHQKPDVAKPLGGLCGGERKRRW